VAVSSSIFHWCLAVSVAVSSSIFHWHPQQSLLALCASRWGIPPSYCYHLVHTALVCPLLQVSIICPVPGSFTVSWPSGFSSCPPSLSIPGPGTQISHPTSWRIVVIDSLWDPGLSFTHSIRIKSLLWRQTVLMSALIFTRYGTLDKWFNFHASVSSFVKMEKK
jgi:hypothetical protein